MFSVLQSVHSKNSRFLGSLLETHYKCVTAITTTLKQNTNCANIQGLNFICLTRSFWWDLSSFKVR